MSTAKKKIAASAKKAVCVSAPVNEYDCPFRAATIYASIESSRSNGSFEEHFNDQLRRSSKPHM